MLPTTVVPRYVCRLKRVASFTLAVVLFLGILPESASAASSWSPTLLVNTESFQTIDAGDGTTDIELRFGSTTTTIKFLNASQIFQFSKGISVVGTISGSKLAIDGNATFSGSVLVKNNIAAKGTVSGSTINGFGLGSCSGSNQKLTFNTATGKFECATDLTGGGSAATGALAAVFDNRYVNTSGDTMTGSLKVRAGLSGSYLTVDHQANISGALTVKGATTLNSTLSVTGNASTDSDFTLNNDAGSVDAVLTFGNASGNQTIKFLNTNQKFQFSAGLNVLGTISGSKLSIDGNATFSGSVLVKNNIAAKGTVSGSTINGFGLGSCNGANQKLVFNNATNKFECATDLNTATPAWSNTGSLQNAFDARFVNTSGDTMTGSLKVRAGLSGAYLTVDHQANISGALTVKGATQLNSTLGVTGNVSTDSDLTINNDAGSVDAVLTFGNASGNQTIKFLNTLQKFEFSRSIRVLGTISGSALRVDGNATIGGPLTVTGSIKTKGNLSGSTLTVDGNMTLHGVTYSAPSTQGGVNTVLKNDGAGNLTWSSTIANGSGGIVSLHPEYPNAVYFSSGATYIGQMTMSGGTSALDNSYVWTSTRGTLQDYWISVRVRVPDNFSSWDPVKPIELRYKTGTASAADNVIKVLVRDTTGTYVALTGGESLAATSWTTALVTGPQAAGTWTPKGYMTVYVKLSAKSTAGANAAAGYLNLNYETTTP